MSGLSVLKRAECRSVIIPGLGELSHQQTTTMSRVSREFMLIRGNNRLTARVVADEVGISTVSCHQIFTEKLQMRRVSEKNHAAFVY
jgi:high-affinity K+ transport system ATPase subunit B